MSLRNPVGPCSLRGTCSRGIVGDRMTLSRILLSAFLLPGAAALSSAAGPKPLSKNEQAALALQVRNIFEAKCVDCHGPELPRPKGKFGYVLDLKRVADNSDYIVRGEPEKSELYTMVRDDEMPGEDASVPPLTAQEKETVKRWIASGAPAKLPVAIVKEAPTSSLQDKPMASLPTWKRAIRWLGR